jgi:alpha-1,2-mannosyltransferase
MLDRLSRVPKPLLKRAVLGLGFALVAGVFILIIRKPRGDFDLHYGLGMRLVAGQDIYGPGFDRVYPPFWAFVHAPFTFFNYHADEIALFPLGVAGMVALVLLLNRLAERPWPMSPDMAFWSGTLAVLLAAPFLQRDLFELGVNTLLVLLTWFGIYLWTRGRDVLGGIPIGIAAALKCTPLAFVAYFFWKRQWKIAISGTVATIFFTCLPATVMGIQKYAHAEAYWFKDVWQGVSDPNPSRTVLGPDRVGNLSLRTALARYLVSLPYGNPGRPETPVDSLIPDEPPEPLYYDVFTLQAPTAGKIVKLILLLIAGTTAWLFRHRVSDHGDPRILWECAAISVAILLYSPLTWGQHCPGVLPAFYFMFRAFFAGKKPPRFVPAVLWAFFIIIVVLERGILGRRWAGLLDAYHLRNFCLLGLFWATVRCRGIGPTGSGEPDKLKTVEPLFAT